jgi:hypothetical protein
MRAWTLLGRASRVLSGSRMNSMSDRTAEAWVDLFWPARARWSLRAMERPRLQVVPDPPGAPAPGEPVSHRTDAEPRRHRVRVEMGPVWNVSDSDRGVVCEGPVGTGGSAGFGRSATLRPSAA